MAALTVRYAGAAGLTALVFNVTSGANATISGLTVTGGNVTGGPLGGGITLAPTVGQPPATLALDGVRVAGNATTGRGGGIYATNAVVTIASSVIENNQAGNGGGGLYLSDTNGPASAILTNTVVARNTGGSGGGGIEARNIDAAMRGVTLTLRGGAVRDNTGDGILGAGKGDADDPTLDLADATVTGNTGSGVDAYYSRVTAVSSTIASNGAKGLQIGFASLALTNSTVSGNATGISAAYATVKLLFATITGNGGGLSSGAGATTTVRASVVAGNTAADCAVGSAPDGTITSEGDNLVGPPCPRRTASTGSDILLTGALSAALVPTLAANGRPTPTHDVIPGGPAHDRITTDRCTVSGDQRGLPTSSRPQGARCDIGAVEYTTPAPTPTPSPSPSSGPSTSPAPTTSPTPAPSPSGPPPSFADVPVGYWAHDQIIRFAQRGITTGCDTDAAGIKYYCPERPVTRAEMAAFLIRTLTGTTAAPAGPATPTFADVPANHPQYGYIEALVARGITTGCGGGDYCPDREVTRAEMAAFIIRALTGQTAAPPGPATATFGDVPLGHPQYGFIEAMFTRGVTTGCGDTSARPRTYCPDSNVTRAEMAVFVIRAYP